MQIEDKFQQNIRPLNLKNRFQKHLVLQEEILQLVYCSKISGGEERLLLINILKEKAFLRFEV